MAWLVRLLPVLVLVSLARCSALPALLGAVSDVVQRELATVSALVVDPVAVGIASSQCGTVKEITGVTYAQLEGENEPNLNGLTLEFTDPEVSIVFNITVAAERIPRAHRYEPDQKLYLLVTGYTDDPSGDTIKVMRDALLSQGNVARASGKSNVLAMNTNSLTDSQYPRASTYARFIGDKLGEVLAAMVDNAGLEPSQIHMIGFSLGAQVIAFAGKSFANRTGVRVGRITGLDPVNVCFDGAARLEHSDAAFVDVIHTNVVIGYSAPIGQVNYYPNGGRVQPGCRDGGCHHGRSWKYFAESITAPHAFPALRCQDWDAFKRNQCEDDVSPMGYPSKPGTTGLYFLQTRGESPYGLGEQGLKWRNDFGMRGILDAVLTLIFGLLPG